MTSRDLVQQIDDTVSKSNNQLDLEALQGLFLRLLTFILCRKPHTSWIDLSDETEDLFQLVIKSREIQEISSGKECHTISIHAEARNLIQEIGSVLSEEENRKLNDLLVIASDRFTKKR